jgi:predicted alpha/beta hydrolase
MPPAPSFLGSRAQPRASTSARVAAPLALHPRAMQEVQVDERFEIEASDGELLAATLHSPAGDPKAALQIHPAMGVKRQFYRHFAAYLASQGYAVLTFDLRGTGDSRPEKLRGYRASLTDWGKKDMPAALAWLAHRYPNIPRFAVAHSMGGQMTGLMPNHHLLSGLVLVFAPKGSLYALPAARILQGLLFLGAYMPLTIPLFGYAPVRFVMNGQDLPAGVAWEWIRWTMNFGWIAGHFAARSEEIFYAKIKAPIRALALDNDSLATPVNCEKLLREYYSGAQSELVTLRAADAPGSLRLDHLGYFRKGFADSHWSQVAAWLDQRVAQLLGEHVEDARESLTA